MTIDKNIPNYLTAARVISIPIIIITFYFENSKFAHQIGALIFVIASLTDFFDGYIARRYNIISNFGQMLDPIADKLLVGCIVIMLVKTGKAGEIPAMLILSREFLVAGFREFLAQKNVKVTVSKLAKVKTCTQMAAITILILGSKGSGIEHLDLLGQVGLWAAAILTIFTGISYFKEYIKNL